MADMLGKHPREDGAPPTEELIRRTLRFLMSVACERVFHNRRVTGGHAIGKGFWFKFEQEGPAQKTETDKIVAEMRSLIKEALPIVRSDQSYLQMLNYFQQTSQFHAAKLLDARVPIDGIVKVSSPVRTISLFCFTNHHDIFLCCWTRFGLWLLEEKSIIASRFSDSFPRLICSRRLEIFL
jgi:hypothetical protein